MYILERTRKFYVSMSCLSAASFIFTIIAFANGGDEILFYGYMNHPATAILMFIFAAIFILSWLMGIGFRAVSKDIAEELKYLENKK